MNLEQGSQAPEIIKGKTVIRVTRTGGDGKVYDSRLALAGGGFVTDENFIGFAYEHEKNGPDHGGIWEQHSMDDVLKGSCHLNGARYTFEVVGKIDDPQHADRKWSYVSKT